MNNNFTDFNKYQLLTNNQKFSLIKLRNEWRCQWVCDKKIIKYTKKIILDYLPQSKSKHHIFPQSKYKKDYFDTVNIDLKTHQKYHSLFADKDPYEILDFIIKCWGGHDEIIFNYIFYKYYDKN